jgi:uncharacterized membrane protein YfcA
MEALLGFFIALIIGMTGAGGGSLTVPVLILLCKMPVAEAVGTSMLFGTIVKLLSAPAYILRRQCNAAALGRLLVGGLPGVAAGTLLLRQLSTPALQHTMLAIAGGAIAISALASLWRLRHTATPPAASTRLRWLPWIALPIGLEVGFSSAGAGALTGIALLSFTSLATPAIVGTDLVFGLCLSAAGSGLHLAFGRIDGPAVAQLLAGGVAGALVGPWLAVRLPVRAMRTALSVLLAILGAEMFWRGVAPLVG